MKPQHGKSHSERQADTTPAPAATRGRPRKLTTDEKIRVAAREILSERGFEAASIEAIAQRAGVTRPTIYRRWPSKAHLISEIVIRGPGLSSMFTSANIEQTIRTFVDSMIAVYGKPDMRAALAGLVSTYQAAPALRLELEGSTEAFARKEFESIIRAHQVGGDIRKEISPDTLFDMIIGTIFYRFLGSSFEPSPDFAAEICEIVSRGIRSLGEEIEVALVGDS